ncbi:uncharacterized protein LOC141608092 [Silene latifolia]|uniref:uncharacterized protein LOC141608092 n=1 Tax=Silene latifolia TaxID=37657 RepID=UPI003D771B69
MEYLSRLIERVVKHPGFSYHPLCKQLKMTHLMFADDLLLFCKGDIRSVTILMEAFKVFRATTGLNISTGKSDIYMSGVVSDEAKAMLDATGFKRGVLPFKYLRIQALCRNFLWEGGDSYSKAPLVGRNILCKGKDLGGLRLTDSRVWNLAAIGKLAWWIQMKKDMLWIRWIDSIYLKGRPWMTYTPTPNSSWAWRMICNVKEKFKAAYENEETAYLGQIEEKWAFVRLEAASSITNAEKLCGSGAILSNLDGTEFLQV